MSFYCEQCDSIRLNYILKMDSKISEYDSDTPAEIVESAKTTIENLLPEKWWSDEVIEVICKVIWNW